jgi:hypothetical protein
VVKFRNFKWLERTAVVKQNLYFLENQVVIGTDVAIRIDLNTVLKIVLGKWFGGMQTGLNV